MTSRTFLAVVAAVLLAVAGSSLLGSAMLAPMGYAIAEITVTDADAYKQYAAAVAPIVARFGLRYVVRGGQTVALEGDPPGGRIVAIEFDSLAAARCLRGFSGIPGSCTA